VQRDPGRDVTGKPLPPGFHILTPEQWVTERTAVAEDLLWRKTCKQCHTLTSSSKSSRGKMESSAAQGNYSDGLPSISAELGNVAPANITLQWMTHDKFAIGAHVGLNSLSCTDN